MKITVAIDSFKGSLTTLESGAAVSEAAFAVFDNPTVTVCPLADGGEGTVLAVTSALGGEIVALSVTGPLGTPVTAEYGYIKDRKLAVIEMSAAAGLPLLPTELRDPLNTTTYGVGELIAHAVRTLGCRNFLIGIGGSATNDGGTGMLSALGYEFLDSDGQPIPLGARGLSRLAEIRTDRVSPELSECEISVACDVKNPLCGDLGCSAVFGPQKGATPDSVRDMDGWLASYAALTEKTLGRGDANYPGAGAAGGMGFALLAYLGARLEPGIELVMRVTDLASHLADADLVVTGEGRLDGQSCMGKAPVGVALAAKKFGKTVVAFSGAATPDAHLVNDCGIDAYFPIPQSPVSLAEAMDVKVAYENLKSTAMQVFRLIAATKK